MQANIKFVLKYLPNDSKSKTFQVRQNRFFRIKAHKIYFGFINPISCKIQSNLDFVQKNLFDLNFCNLNTSTHGFVTIFCQSNNTHYFELQ